MTEEAKVQTGTTQNTPAENSTKESTTSQENTLQAPSQKKATTSPSTDKTNDFAREHERIIGESQKKLSQFSQIIVFEIKELQTQHQKQASESRKTIEDVKKQMKQTEDVVKNLEIRISEMASRTKKLIGLYEVITNEFNPFIEKTDTSQKNTTDDKKKPSEKPAEPDQKATPQTHSVPHNTTSHKPIDVEQQERKESVAQNTTHPAQHTTPHHPAGAQTSMHTGQPQDPRMQWSFVFNDNTEVSSLMGLFLELVKMDTRTYADYVTVHHNEFAEWIKHSLGYPQLAKQLQYATRAQTLQILGEVLARASGTR